jgi:hypothetical protein
LVSDPPFERLYCLRGDAPQGCCLKISHPQPHSPGSLVPTSHHFLALPSPFPGQPPAASEMVVSPPFSVIRLYNSHRRAPGFATRPRLQPQVRHPPRCKEVGPSSGWDWLGEAPKVGVTPLQGGFFGLGGFLAPHQAAKQFPPQHTPSVPPRVATFGHFWPLPAAFPRPKLARF